MSSQPPVRLGAEERRRQLLETALHTFGERGFTATSMNDVAEAAGVTKPVLYQHFESKHELYLELLTDTANRLKAVIQAAVEAEAEARGQVDAAFGAFFDFFEVEPGNFTVLYGEGVRSDPSFISELRGVEDSLTDFAADMLTIESMSAEDRLLVACGIAGLLEGAVRRWIQDGRTIPAATMAAKTADLAWRGLRNV